MSLAVRIRRSDRVDFFGRTGSGKTTLARSLLRGTELPYAVLDPKWRYTDPGVPILHDFNARKREQIIRADPLDFDHWNEILYRLWDRGDAIVYVDEVTLLLPTSRTILPWHRRAIVTGRERELAVWNATQRPREIGSSVIFTEAEHFFLFRLQFTADREHVAAFTSDEVAREYRHLQKAGIGARHDFLYYGPERDRLVRFYATRGGTLEAHRAAEAPAAS